MRTLSKLLGACAITALAGSAAWAASTASQHRLTVWLPGGGSETITYAGAVAPKVSFTPSDFAVAPLPSPAAFDAMAFDGAMPIDRISAAMDADMAYMMRQADAMMAMPVMVAPFNGITEADLNGMPPGSQSYSVVSTMNGNNVCTRSVQVTESGHGKPEVVRHSSGNCAGVPGDSVLFHLAPQQGSHLMTIKSMAPEFAPASPHI
ncbi:MAG TPA: hypothetical protein VN718_02780 [Rhizomicrobium sp.]|nr:hypothetical protein [Rhizomicrobium sp.]